MMLDVTREWELLSEAQENVPVQVEQIPEKLGIEYRLYPFRNGISGMLERLRTGFRITVNEFDPFTRRRFTVAHELGHYMLHGHLLKKVGDGLDDDALYRSTEVGKYHNTEITQKQETEANRFAANLLMPYERVWEQFREENATPERLARLFQVSQRSMEIRLGMP